jgi:murein DD-endopeptidase MepM/ murein hydrolase activator NlpD
MAPPALQIAGLAVGRRSMIVRALAIAAAAPLALLVLVVSPLALLASVAGPGPAAPPHGIPAEFLAVYRESARVFDLDWLVLASIHDQETGFSTNPTTYHGLNPAGCCAGPFQINLTNGPSSTWDTHRTAFHRGQRPAQYPHRQPPHPSVYDDFDAAMAAASLLRDDGADSGLGEQTWNAVRAYNGAGPVAVTYANAVLSRARAWAQAPNAPALTPGAGRAALVWPVRGPITSPFCERRAWEACHPGIDIAVRSGTVILAAASGRVSLTQTTGQSGGYGNYTCLQHTAAVSTCYAHQATILVRLGQLVARGQAIGSSDCTGRCYGPHLHFEVRLNGQPVCPAPYLDASSTELCAPGSPGS